MLLEPNLFQSFIFLLDNSIHFLLFQIFTLQHGPYAGASELEETLRLVSHKRTKTKPKAFNDFARKRRHMLYAHASVSTSVFFKIIKELSVDARAQRRERRDSEKLCQ